MDYTIFPNFNSILWLMIAPPAWGKTYRLLDLFQKRSDVVYVFVSPLRALANEFNDKISSQFHSLLIENFKSWEKFSGQEQVIILTPELLLGQLHRLNRIDRPILFILDEFHLYSYWGTTFRECMWEGLIEIALTEKPVLAMTATYGQREEDFFINQLRNQMELIVKIDQGNQRLLYPPSEIRFISPNLKSKIKYFVLFELEKKKQGSVLFFVEYRALVQEYEKIFSSLGFRVLSCIGGEAAQFSLRLHQVPDPDLIIATTVLSHGVNLPKISSILFSYELKNDDFWIQMVGRGGRKGEKYNLYTFDKRNISCWSKLKSFVKLKWILIISSLSPWDPFADED
jgi:superfamily II DNA or RNA helicase